MNRAFWWILYVLCPAAIIFAFRQSREWSHSIPAMISHDLGPIFVDLPSVKVGHSFVITNNSPSLPLTLRLAARSCTCLISGAQDLTIPPRAAGEVALSAAVGPIERVTQKRWHASFSTNREDQARIGLEFTALAIPTISIDTDFESLYEVVPGGSRHLSIETTIRVPQSHRLPEPRIVSTGQHLSVVETRRTVKSFAQFQALTIGLLVRIDCPTNASTGEKFDGVLAIVGEGAAATRAISWIPRSRIAVFPRSLFIKAEGGEATIELSASEPFRLADIEITDNMLIVDYDPDRVAERLSVSIRPNPLSIGASDESVKMLVGSVRIRTTYPEHPDVVVPFAVSLASAGPRGK